MSWLEENKRGWRIGFLIILFVAIIGPWFLERINIPAPYDCAGNRIRLDDDFCGTPKSILWIPVFALFNLKEFITGLLSGAITSASLLLLSATLIIIMLPPFSALMLMRYEDHPRRKKLQIVTLTLAAAASLLWVALLVQDYSSGYWAIWGLWLYISAAAGMLILESLLLLQSRQAAYE